MDIEGARAPPFPVGIVSKGMNAYPLKIWVRSEPCLWPEVVRISRVGPSLSAAPTESMDEDDVGYWRRRRYWFINGRETKLVPLIFRLSDGCDVAHRGGV